jgi:hypothetical protein
MLLSTLTSVHSIILKLDIKFKHKYKSFFTMPLCAFVPVHSIVFKTRYSIQAQVQMSFSPYHFVPLRLFTLLFLKLDIQFKHKYKSLFTISLRAFAPVHSIVFKTRYSIQAQVQKSFHFATLCLCVCSLYYL